MIPVAVPPGPFALEKLNAKRHVRIFSLSDLEVPPDKTCVWCNKSKINPPKRRWCDDSNCVQSAIRYCHPQADSSKGWILFEQSFACAGCGLSFEDTFRKKAIAKIRRQIRRAREKRERDERFKIPTIHYFREKVSLMMLSKYTGDILHIDHKIPLFKGGDGIGRDNLQVLCVQCHRKKTAQERGKNAQEQGNLFYRGER